MPPPPPWDWDTFPPPSPRILAWLEPAPPPPLLHPTPRLMSQPPTHPPVSGNVLRGQCVPGLCGAQRSLLQVCVGGRGDRGAMRVRVRVRSQGGRGPRGNEG